MDVRKPACLPYRPCGSSVIHKIIRSPKGLTFIIGILVIGLGSPVRSAADVIRLKNNNELNGEIVSETDKEITIKISGLGEMSVNKAEIAAVEHSTQQKNDPGGQQKEVPSESATLFGEGTRLLKEGQWKEAVDRFNAALQLDDQHVGSRVNLGCALALLGEVDEAAQQFEKALVLADASTQPFVHFNLGGLWAKRFFVIRDTESGQKATNHFRKAAEQLPYFVLALDWANHIAKFMDMDEGLGKELAHRMTFELSVDKTGIPPDSAFFLREDQENVMGEAYVFDSNTPAALYFYQSPSTSLLRGQATLVEKRVSDAERLFRDTLASLENEPRNRLNALAKWNAHVGLATVYKSRQKWDLAVEQIQAAKSLGLSVPVEEQMLQSLQAHLEKKNSSSTKTVAVESPRISEDGFYRHEKYGLRIKKPVGWLVFDEETNSELFAKGMAGQTEIGLRPLFVFAETLGGPRATLALSLSAEPATNTKLDEAELLTRVKANMERLPPIIEIVERPSVFKIGPNRFIRSAIRVTDKTGRQTLTIHHYLLTRSWVCILTFICPQGDIERHRDVLQDTLASVMVD